MSKRRDLDDPTIKLDEAVRLINQEIQWCYQDKSGIVSEEYREAFIKGLKQAKFLIVKLGGFV